jgi:tyrosine-protein phosphatase OCA1
MSYSVFCGFKLRCERRTMSFLVAVQSPEPIRHGAFAPLNYGMVSDTLHRSAMPEARHFPFLELIGFRSIIVLSPAGPTPDMSRWASDAGVAILHPTSVQTKVSTSLSEVAAAELVSLLLSETLPTPTLVTCPSGRYRTGLVVGCLRKAQHWNTAAILEEYRRFAEGRARVENEDFMEMFDVSLVTLPT